MGRGGGGGGEGGEREIYVKVVVGVGVCGGIGVRGEVWDERVKFFFFVEGICIFFVVIYYLYFELVYFGCGERDNN